jgi:predicted RNA binding protein YcfA (HicA-like mRNA interferase family)
VPPKVRDIIAELEADDWRMTSQEGSHRQFEHPTKPGKVTIAGKPGIDVPAGVLGSIRRQSGLPELGRSGGAQREKRRPMPPEE